MLHFTKEDAPALPIHDSFIMHHGYAGELEEAMRRSFFDRFKKHIIVKTEIIEEVKPKDTDPNDIEWDDISIEAILKGDKEYSKWQVRDAMWLNRSNNS